MNTTTTTWPGLTVVQPAIERPTAMRLAQPEYQRGCVTRGHAARGLSRTVVSAIHSGAGSVAVSARPILP